ncbi:2-phosphosulfolactate phosphatase [Sporomusa sp.]|jgi:2-phosphosulfolactate phosphatase|uniref:2-phosphosulfolactate phosphatase n=1 Tax=Sporomusa sp. TaxID=2078658 RepID=UPI002CAB2392|nr:2-phosphosulfolactate phosphatase [Sporomusa sp.]MDF2874884.1 comB [Sporomusa sp.]HWR05380.1 2-phosphosulfolactate phosphatase [Sporomusa sp.]
MNIDVAFLPAEVNGVDISNTTCIVLDIFRATTSIVTAMANGCKTVTPVLSVNEARLLANQENRSLLAGERQSIKIEGFDFGNSPFDFSESKVRDRQIIMTTTNGTTAIKATEGAARTLIGSFINASAVCRQAKQYGQDILIVCAGTDCLFSLEDALCAGFLTDILLSEAATVPTMTDAASGALLMYTQAKGALGEIAKNSRNGKRLCELGREEDANYCFQIDLFTIVPEYKNRMITTACEL